MKSTQLLRGAVKSLVAAIGLATASYAAYVGVTWRRYGKLSRAAGQEADALLDVFMPNYEVVDLHKVARAGILFNRQRAPACSSLARVASARSLT
jgi:hypothetical protein